MKSAALLMLFLGLLCSLHAQAAGPMGTTPGNAEVLEKLLSPSRRMDVFKASVGWDRKMAADDRRLVVHREWRGLGGPAGIEGLAITAEEVTPMATANAKGERFISNGTFEGKGVSILVTRTRNIDDAAGFFLAEVDNTSRTLLNYVAGPRDLGTVAATYDSPGPGGSLLWLYKNLCIDVRGADFKSVMRLSRKVQALAERSLVAAGEPAASAMKGQQPWR